MTFGRGVRNVEGMVEMNAAPVVSPLNSLDCARINVGPGGRGRGRGRAGEGGERGGGEKETRRRGKMSISSKAGGEKGTERGMEKRRKGKRERER